MALKRIGGYSGTVTEDAQVELDAIDVSGFDEIYATIEITGAPGADGTDTLDVYLQSRSQANVWADRIAFDQLTGAMSEGELREATLQKFGTFSDGEEQGEPSGSTGGSRLTAGTVRNGAFPGRYRNPGVGTETAWRLDFQVTSGNAASFPVEVTIYGDTAG